MYVVEIGGLDVLVTLLKKGNKEAGVKPVFDVDCGVRWQPVATSNDNASRHIR